MNIQMEQQEGRYYDADHYPTAEEALSQGTWFVVIIGFKEEPVSEEFDVMARDRREAFAVAKVVLKRDYDDGLQITDLVVA
jgi:hypothetical protein